jgi:hypothetical protein
LHRREPARAIRYQGSERTSRDQRTGRTATYTNQKLFLVTIYSFHTLLECRKRTDRIVSLNKITPLRIEGYESGVVKSNNVLHTNPSRIYITTHQ